MMCQIIVNFIFMVTYGYLSQRQMVLSNPCIPCVLQPIIGKCGHYPPILSPKIPPTYVQHPSFIRWPCIFFPCASAGSVVSRVLTVSSVGGRFPNCSTQREQQSGDVKRCTGTLQLSLCNWTFQKQWLDNRPCLRAMLQEDLHPACCQNEGENAH